MDRLMFGARRDEEGIWRLCEKRGRLIKQVSGAPDDYPIAFRDRTAAEECADELNATYWDDYKARRRLTRGYTTQRGILEIVVSHGGMTRDDLERSFTP